MYHHPYPGQELYDVLVVQQSILGSTVSSKVDSWLGRTPFGFLTDPPSPGSELMKNAPRALSDNPHSSDCYSHLETGS